VAKKKILFFLGFVVGGGGGLGLVWSGGVGWDGDVGGGRGGRGLGGCGGFLVGGGVVGVGPTNQPGLFMGLFFWGGITSGDRNVAGSRRGSV